MEDHYFRQFKDFDKEFVYICITADIEKNSIFKDTIFLGFDNNIVEHCRSNLIISTLPSTIDEYINPWPFSNTNRMNKNYAITYLNEKYVDSKFLENLSTLYFGCVFIPGYISEDIIEKITKISKVPVILLEKKGSKNNKNLYIDKNITTNIFKYWEKSFYETQNIPKEKKSNGPLLIKDKTEIKPVIMPSVGFLEPLNILIDRCRGLYKSVEKGRILVEPSNIEIKEKKEKEAMYWNNLYLKKLLAEKYLIKLIETKNFEILEDLSLKCSTPLKNDYTINDLELIYEELSEYLTSNFPQVAFLSNMIIVVPSINKPVIESFNKRLGRKKLPNKVLRRIFKPTGYYEIINKDDINANNKEKQKIYNGFLEFSMNEKLKENLILSRIFTKYALGSLLPFLRLPYVPTDKIYNQYLNMQKSSKRSDELLQIQKFNDNLKEITNTISNVLQEDTKQIISSNGKHIKFITDLPVEWVLNNNLPLYVEKSLSRVPILTGNGVIAHSYFNSASISFKTIKILILNTLEKNDGLYIYGKELFSSIQNNLGKHQNKVEYFEPNNKDEFVNKINEYQPTLLIYYGHGKFGERDTEGSLIIKNERITSIEIEKISWKPLITVLGACETEVLYSNYMNVGNLFLRSGSAAVLATYFPVEGNMAKVFIEGLIRNLINTLNNESPQFLINSWADVILMTRRSHYLLDPIFAMKEYAGSKGIILKIPENVIGKIFSLGTQNKDDIENTYRNRDKYLKEIFADEDLCLEILEIVISKNYIFPRSSIFTSLGSPEKIIISREN